MCFLKKIKMDSFEINKIIAAILVTVLLVFGINKISDLIFHVEKPTVQGYKVEIKVGTNIILARKARIIAKTNT